MLIKKTKAIKKLRDCEELLFTITDNSNPMFVYKKVLDYIDKWYDGDITKKLEHYKRVKYE